MLSRTFLTNLPPITNKGKARINKERTKAIISPKKASNKPILQTIMMLTNLQRIPGIPTNLGRTHIYIPTIHVPSLTSMIITLTNSLTWIACNNFCRMTSNMTQMRLLQHILTYHHQGFHPWCSKIHYHIKGWFQPNPFPHPLPQLLLQLLLQRLVFIA